MHVRISAHLGGIDDILVPTNVGMSFILNTNFVSIFFCYKQEHQSDSVCKDWLE